MGHLIPVGIPVGCFKNVSNQSFPALININNGGFIAISKEEEKSITLIENSILYLVQYTGVENSKILIFDFDIKKKFFFLSKLPNYNIFLNIEDTFQQFKQIKEIIIHRYHFLFSDKIKNLMDYNKNTKFPEPYFFIVINTKYFPNKYIDYQYLTELLDNFYDAGFFVFGYGQPSAISEISLWRRYPWIEINRNQKLKITNLSSKKENSKFIKVFKYLKKYNIELYTIEDNRKNIVSDLLNSKKAGIKKDFLSVPIGYTLDNTSIIEFKLGEACGNYHAFITGNTGTGKTTLLNNIILGIAEKYTAKDIRLFLMDYKEGVEFQVFKNHPNVEKIYLDNEDLEAAVFLLQDFASEIQRRALLFKDKEVTNIEAYNSKNPGNKLPYLILIIDEVHRLFSGSWDQREYFNKLLKDIVRRGRAFGIHLILSTQTLEGVDIDRDIMEQITLRISFKLSNPIASEKIFTWGNTAACNLGKYEFIYNPDSGNPSANVYGKAFPPREIKSILENIIKNRKSDEKIIPTIVVSNNKSPNEYHSYSKSMKYLLEKELEKFNTTLDKELLKKLEENNIFTTEDEGTNMST